MSHSIGIYQNSGSNFSETICSALNLCGLDISLCTSDKDTSAQNTGLSVFTVECAALFPDFLDICILESGYQKSNSFPSADIVIVPDICSVSTISQLRPKSVVTYGLSCKNSVTVSSLIENKLVVSIQREIVSLTGKRIIEQEFPMDLGNINQIEAILAAISVLLLLDIPINTVQDISFTHSTAHFHAG